MPRRDPQIDAHLEWTGFVRPTGLVVSAPALVRAGAVLTRDPEGQRRLRACVAERRFHSDGEPEPWVPDFQAFAASVLGWSFSPKGYAGTDDSPIPPELETPLQEGGEVLRPDFAVRERDPRDDGSRWQLLVNVIEPGDDFDRVAGGTGRLEVSAHGRMERLLRQTGVPAGVLSNGRTLRLVSAPRGESSGWLDLHVADMVTTAGRPIVAALRLLLSETRLLALPSDKRFAALLADSRRFQNEVSERLAEQVLHALYELLRGLQAADDASDRELLREALAERPDDVYHALLTVVLRLVFLLYAEERDLLPEGETFARHYSLAGLYERLREDAALHPDTMNQRYGAWAQLGARQASPDWPRSRPAMPAAPTDGAPSGRTGRLDPPPSSPAEPEAGRDAQAMERFPHTVQHAEHRQRHLNRGCSRIGGLAGTLPPVMLRHGWLSSWLTPLSYHGRGEESPPASHQINSFRECAEETGDDLRVRVPPDQSRSGQVGTESCGRRGNAGFEA